MPRTRSIKPEFWDDEKLSGISRDARLTFIGLWTNSDDYGVAKGHHAWLKNKIFPYDDIKRGLFQQWLKELEKVGVILPFDHNGEKFYHIKNFLNHQVINRPSKAKNPSPPTSLNESSLNTPTQLMDETETETETETEEKSSRLCASSPDFISQLKEIYAWIDVDTEIQKMKGFLLTPKGKGRKLTHAFAVRWLNRVDKPIEETAQNTQSKQPEDKPPDWIKEAVKEGWKT
jgi:hypothetical protein